MNIIIHFKSLFFGLWVTTALLLFANNILDVTHRFGWGVVFVLTFITFLAIYQTGRGVVFSIAPIGIILSSLSLLFFIDSTFKRSVFAIAVGFLYYMSLLAIVRMRNNPKDVTARALLSMSIISTVFFYFAAAYGVYINFYIPLWIFVLINSVVLFFISFTSFRAYTKRSSLRLILVSILISFCIAEITWMINFWPFGYLTDAASVVLFYYVIWDMFVMDFTGNLSKKRVANNILICLILFLLVIVSSKWVLI